MQMLRTFAALSAVIVSFSFTQSANAITTGGCNAITGSSIDSGTCYVADTNSATWASHEAAAVLLGLNLVSIHSAAQNTVVAGIGSANSLGRFWIGFNDIASEGTFVWSDGSAADYTKWAGGEPNDIGGEDVVEFLGEIRGISEDFWNDLSDVATRTALYSGEITVPEPSILAIFGFGFAGLGFARRRRAA